MKNEVVTDIRTNLEDWARLLDISHERTSRAEALYFEHILDWVIETARADPRNLTWSNQRCDLLISLMGFSPETTVITAALLRPKTVAIVANRNVNGSFQRAYDYLASRSGELGTSEIRLHNINPTNYLEIRGVMEIESRGMQPGERALVDITGGKKIMSAIAGQAAWDLNLQLCYLESTAYNPALRRPDPGSEVLLVFPKPSEQRSNKLREEPLELSCYHNQEYLV